ncbi:MAG: DUF2782 domain-containing protein [Chromatiales bacterium]|jgi:hypothetical protein
MKFTVLMGALLLAMPLYAEPVDSPPPVAPTPLPSVPPPPPEIQSGQVLEPGVTIIQTENETIYEYRAGSRLYMVRVVPRVGPPYYFFDRDGDGELDIDKDDPHSNVVNQWILFRW